VRNGLGLGALFRNCLRSRKIATGAAIVITFVFIAVFGPLIDRTNPSALSSAVLQPPSASHWLGTTSTGQDVLAQLIDGTRSSMVIGASAAAIATLLSVCVGVFSGYLGGAADGGLSLLTNVFLVLPSLPLLIVLSDYLPRGGSLGMTLLIAVTGWAWGARVLRAQTLSLRRRDFVLAAKAVGERPARMVFSEILPGLVPVIAAGFCGMFIFAILTETSLNFLGLGLSGGGWSWGTMLYWAESNSAFELGAWWWFVPPGVAVALLGMGLTLVNFGIDEFVNPRLRTQSALSRRARREREVVTPSGTHLSSVGAGVPKAPAAPGIGAPEDSPLPEAQEVTG
jgi:peptide/nickel transport system permease protein